MGNENQSTGIVFQHAFQSFFANYVHMVGRLIKNQHIRAALQNLTECQTYFLAPADTVTIADSGTYHLWDTSKFSYIDTLDASSASGSVAMAGGYGDKTLIGSSYADKLAGTSYNTTIDGGAGNDTIWCKSGKR